MSGLYIVQGDSVQARMRRRGRFSIPVEAAMSEHHLEAAIKEHQALMVDGLGKVGYQYVPEDKPHGQQENGDVHIGGGWTLRGPLPHVAFSDHSDPDPGPMNAPSPQALAQNEGLRRRWERAEKARAARKVGERAKGLVDYELVATFQRKVGSRPRINK